MNLYQHVENLAISYFSSKEIVDLKILQSQAHRNSGGLEVYQKMLPKLNS